MTSLTASTDSQHLSRRAYRLGLAATIVLALMGLGLYVARGASQVNGFGFPLDDSWIHLQIARNLANGHGWSYNPGVPTGAATSPLWVLVITPLFFLGGDVTIWVKVLGSLLYLATILLVADVACVATGDRRVGLVAGALAALQPALIWTALSGMETALYLLLFLLSVRGLLLVEQRGQRAAYASTAWLTLAGYARPELWALLPIFWGYLFWRRNELKGGQWWVHAGIALLGIGGFALFNMALWSHPVPATLMAKRAHLRGYNEGITIAGLRALAGRLTYNLDLTLRSQNAVLLTCLAVGLLAARRSVGGVGKHMVLLVSIILVGIVVISIVNVGDIPFQTYRRAAQVLACMNILVAAGFIATYDVLQATVSVRGQDQEERHNGPSRLQPLRRRSGAIILTCVGLSAFMIQILALRTWGDRYANDVRSINEADVATGRWLAANTPPDALIAVNDAGAIAYFSQRPIFDMIGLASPEALAVLRQTQVASPERDRQMTDLLLEQGADYVAIFPTWFPTLAEDPMLHEVQRFTVKDSTTLGGEEVVIYKVSRENH